MFVATNSKPCPSRAIAVVCHPSIDCFPGLQIPFLDQCLEFSSKTSVIVDEITKESAQLNVIYVVKKRVIQIKVTDFLAPTGTEFYLQPNENSVTCS